MGAAILRLLLSSSFYPSSPSRLSNISQITAFLISNAISKAIYNLYFHPLKDFPGPWLARALGARLGEELLAGPLARAIAPAVAPTVG